MNKKYILAVCAAAALTAAHWTEPVYAKEKTLPDGLYVGDVSLGGMTEEEAEKAVAAKVEELAARQVRLNGDGNEASVAAKELGFAWKNPEELKETACNLAAGNLVQQYMARKDVEKTPVHIPLETEVDEGRVEVFVRENTSGLTAEPQNATITRASGAFHITPSVPGRLVDIAATKKALQQQVCSEEKEITVDVVVAEWAPDITESDLSSIQDVLGTYTTNFSSSNTSRRKNLANGANKINGHVLMPGQMLSGYECMHPFTTANGYYTAAAYENGRVVDSVGGGVCQIATTLYNAALRAELEINQRQNHSMIVAYVKPSMDAAIAGTVKDIRFTNNYSTPIFVEGRAENGKLTFTIYGRETRPVNRTLDFVSETLSSVSPGPPTEQLDMSLAPGSRKQVQSAHQGLKSRLWKIVKVDGVVTEKILLHTDTYNASKAIVLVGPPVPAAPPRASRPAESAAPTTTAGAPEAARPGVAETTQEPETAQAGEAEATRPQGTRPAAFEREETMPEHSGGTGANEAAQSRETGPGASRTWETPSTRAPETIPVKQPETPAP